MVLTTTEKCQSSDLTLSFLSSVESTFCSGANIYLAIPSIKFNQLVIDVVKHRLKYLLLKLLSIQTDIYKLVSTYWISTLMFPPIFQRDIEHVRKVSKIRWNFCRVGFYYELAGISTDVSESKNNLPNIYNLNWNTKKHQSSSLFVQFNQFKTLPTVQLSNPPNLVS